MNSQCESLAPMEQDADECIDLPIESRQMRWRDKAILAMGICLPWALLVAVLKDRL